MWKYRLKGNGQLIRLRWYCTKKKDPFCFSTCCHDRDFLKVAFLRCSHCLTASNIFFSSKFCRKLVVVRSGSLGRLELIILWVCEVKYTIQQMLLNCSFHSPFCLWDFHSAVLFEFTFIFLTSVLYFEIQLSHIRRSSRTLIMVQESKITLLEFLVHMKVVYGRLFLA